MVYKCKDQVELAEKIDDWFINVIVNRFNYKGKIGELQGAEGKELRKFFKLKKIRIVLEGNKEKENDRFIIEHKYKPKYVLVVDYKNLEFWEEKSNE